MWKKPIWKSIETTLFYDSGNSTSPHVWTCYLEGYENKNL